MEINLSEQEKKVTNEFLKVVNNVRLELNLNTISEETALKFVFARKFDLSRALLLYQAHEAIRFKEGLINFEPDKDPLKSELESGKFIILPKPDAEGAIITMFTASKHLPSLTSHQTTLQGVVYQLDIALENIKAQKSGIVFIYNMSNSKYSNFDYELSQKILNLLKGAFPARLKKVLIVTAPLWFKAPFKILRLFVREKLRDRVFMINQSHLSNHIPLSSLPVELGGEIKLDHKSWLEYHRTYKPQAWNDLNIISVCNKFPIFSSSVFFQNGAILNSSSNGRFSGEEDSLSIKSGKSESIESNISNQMNHYSIKRKSFFNKHKPENILLPNNILINENNCSAKSDNKFAVQVKMFESLHAQNDGGMSLKEFALHMKEKEQDGLYEEYNAIKSRSLQGTFEFSLNPANQQKNRYKDILCYDHSGVKLSIVNDDPNSAYINANFVDGYNQKSAFISTQGPLASTFCDFWRMIWEQRVLVIVMTTHIVERGRNKCGQYWPLEKDTSVKHGDFLIINKSIEQFGDYSMTKLTISHSLTGLTRDVSHMHYLSWPDYGVPASACVMLKFREKVREIQSLMVPSMEPKWTGHPLGPPIVVHCSAGVGRTGTFITLDICIFRLENTGLINIKETVEKIRSQRALSIQMPDQYVFCYSALLEYALSRGLLQNVDLFRL